MGNNYCLILRIHTVFDDSLSLCITWRSSDNWHAQKYLSIKETTFFLSGSQIPLFSISKNIKLRMEFLRHKYVYIIGILYDPTHTAQDVARTYNLCLFYVGTSDIKRVDISWMSYRRPFKNIIGRPTKDVFWTSKT